MVEEGVGERWEMKWGEEGRARMKRKVECGVGGNWGGDWGEKEDRGGGYDSPNAAILPCLGSNDSCG